jgi:uncharacterized protein (DUF433 family)
MKIAPFPFSFKMQENFSDLPISINPQVLGGTPVFVGTRVPVSSLFSYLEKDYSLEEFLDFFPSVSREAAIVVLTQAERFTIEHANA